MVIFGFHLRQICFNALNFFDCAGKGFFASSYTYIKGAYSILDTINKLIGGNPIFLVKALEGFFLFLENILYIRHRKLMDGFCILGSFGSSDITGGNSKGQAAAALSARLRDSTKGAGTVAAVNANHIKTVNSCLKIQIHPHRTGIA